MTEYLITYRGAKANDRVYSTIVEALTAREAAQTFVDGSGVLGNGAVMSRHNPTKVETVFVTPLWPHRRDERATYSFVVHPVKPAERHIVEFLLTGPLAVHGVQPKDY